MINKNLRILEFLFTALVALLMLMPSKWSADEVSRRSFDAGVPAVSMAGILNVREDPTTHAPVVTQIPRDHAVAILERLRRTVTINGREGQWVFIATSRCADTDCARLLAGWVVDFYLDPRDES